MNNELNNNDNDNNLVNDKSEIPQAPNGGLYGGPQQNKPWLPIHIEPTAFNLIANNLSSANPPPGAIDQFIGLNRLGNNLNNTKNIDSYDKQSGKYRFKVILD